MVWPARCLARARIRHGPRAGHKEYLVDQKGIPLDSLTVTSCDADSLVHPAYFAELTRQFVSDDRRYERIWQAPFRFNNNIWRSPAPIRLLGFLNNMVQVSELANPLAVNMPLSTYSLSFRLADDVGYWDEMVIAEDWHILLRCLYGTGGRATLAAHLPAHLPETRSPVTRFGMLSAFSTSSACATLGGLRDIGYILQQWNRWPDVPFWPKASVLAKVLHDHIVFTVAGLMLGVGSVVMILQHGLLAVAAPFPGLYTFLLQSGNGLTAVGTFLAWLYEHLTSRRASPGWRPDHLLSELLTWPSAGSVHAVPGDRSHLRGPVPPDVRRRPCVLAHAEEGGRPQLAIALRYAASSMSGTRGRQQRKEGRAHAI